MTGVFWFVLCRCAHGWYLRSHRLWSVSCLKHIAGDRYSSIAAQDKCFVAGVSCGMSNQWFLFCVNPTCHFLSRIKISSHPSSRWRAVAWNKSPPAYGKYSSRPPAPLSGCLAITVRPKSLRAGAGRRNSRRCFSATLRSLLKRVPTQLLCRRLQQPSPPWLRQPWLQSHINALTQT